MRGGFLTARAEGKQKRKAKTIQVVMDFKKNRDINQYDLMLSLM